METPSKSRIRAAFGRAAGRYDQAATIQRTICQRLAELIPADCAPQRLLDAGTGTGYALGLLGERFPGAEPVALDFAPAMLARVPPPTGRVAGDIEALPLATASIDLYWSSLAVQWCDLRRALSEARRVLRPGGHLLLATLTSETFGELRQAFAGIDTHRHTLAFEPPAAIANALSATGFRIGKQQREHHVAHFPDLVALLGSIKAIGANQLGDSRRRALLGRGAFRQAAATWETLRTPAGLPLSYDTLLFAATR